MNNMQPSLLLDNSSDFNPDSDFLPSASRTLLLAPPSIAAHEEKLRNILSQYDRSVTDLQMIDRLSTGVAKLPQSTYDLISILNGADGTRTESAQLLDRNVFQQIFKGLKNGGRLETQDRTLGQDQKSVEFIEAILAGLVLDDGVMMKPKYSVNETVPIKLGRGRDKNLAIPITGISKTDNAGQINKDTTSSFEKSYIKSGESNKIYPENKYNITDEDEEELIDEDTLLTEEELNRPLNIPAECAPRAGQRRRACKDCTCGLAEKLAAEDAAARSNADAQLRVIKLETDELAEVDFTVQGKVGSCGNCSLGDAFRCAGCPFIGMPAFKPGEEVRLLNNDVQL